MKSLTIEQQIKVLEAIDYVHMVGIEAGLCYAVLQSCRKIYNGPILPIDISLLFPLFTNKNALQFGAYETENSQRFWWKITPESLPQRKQFIDWMIFELKKQLQNETINS